MRLGRDARALDALIVHTVRLDDSLIVTLYRRPPQGRSCYHRQALLSYLWFGGGQLACSRGGWKAGLMVVHTYARLRRAKTQQH